MSLDELLRHQTDSSRWMAERKKLIIVAAVLSVLALSAAVVSLIFVSNKKQSQTVQRDAESLANLMLVRDEAGKLEQEVVLLRQAAPSRRRGNGTGRSSQTPRVVDYDPGEGFAKVTTERENLYIPTGAVFIAQLITPIKTSVERTFVMANVIRDFRMDMKRRIPSGSRLIGRSHLDPTLKGVIVEFDTLVLPTGIESSLSGLALSKSALPEIEGLYFSNKLETYGTALAFGFLSGFAGGAVQRDPSIYGSVPQVNLPNQMLMGLSSASFQIAEDMIRSVRERAVEYVVVPSGEQIFVALTRRYDINQEQEVQR